MLMLASKDGLVDVVMALYKHGADLNYQTNKGVCALMVACEAGYYSVVRYLINHGATVNLFDERHWTPLMYACAQGHIECAQLLLACQADLAATDVNGWNALLLACLNGSVPLIELLVACGADVRSRDVFGNDVLTVASINGHKLVIRMFMQEHAVACQPSSESGHTALHSACYSGDVSTVETILSAVEDTPKADEGAFTPLMMASKCGHVQVACLLMDKGCQVNGADKAGYTALHYAAKENHPVMVNILQAAGADLRSLTQDGWSALMLASKYNSWDSIVQLLSHDRTVMDMKGRTALLLAAIYGHIDAAKALISFGTSIHHLDDMNWNALMHACYHNHTAMCTYLVSIGADYLHASTDQWTALSLAVFRGCKEIALYLLTFPQLQECVTHLYSPNGYNILQLALFGKHYELAQELVHGGYIYIDSYSRSGLTALMYQAQLGDVESIDLLLTLSADINKKSEAGTTALMVAIASEQQDCASTLLSRGANPMDKDQAGNTSLVLAAKHSSSDSNMPLVEHILSAMPLDKVSPPEAQQVFMLAAVNGNPQLAQVLLTHGVDPNHQDAQGNTALLLAVDHGNTVIVTSLVQQPHVDATIKNAQGESALLLACRKGHIELCTSLLAVSADCINDSDDTGAFPLLHWTAHASLPMIKQLVKHGANVNQQTKDGTSALMLAVDAKQHRITKWLLKQGVDANLVTHDGYTSLMIAVANKDAVSTNLLLNMGANVDLYTTTGSSALMSACIHGNLDILRAILARHADIDHQHDTNDYTALHYAVESGSLSAILSLLGHGADATLQTRDKSTPLLLALTKSRSDIALVLVSYQPSVIHVPDIHGNTPLLIATKHNLVHVVQKLCAYGADTNIANHHDETPLLAACHSHNSDLVTCLVSYHASVHFDHIQACLGHNDDSFTRLLLYTGGLRLGLGLDNHDPFDMLDDCFKASETKLQSLLRTIQQEQVYVTQVMDVTYRMDILLSMIGHVQREEYEIRSYLVTQFYVVVVTLETLIQTRKDALVQQVDELLYVMVEHLDRVEEVLQQQQ